MQLENRISDDLDKFLSRLYEKGNDHYTKFISSNEEWDMVDSQQILTCFLDQLRELRERELRANRKISDIDNEIKHLAEQDLVLIRLKAKGFVDPALFLSQQDEIERKLRDLRSLRRRILETAEEDSQIQAT